MSMPEALHVATRVWTVPMADAARPAAIPGHGTRSRRSAEPIWPKYVLIFDTETTVDAAQSLLFGTYLFCQWTDTTPFGLAPLEEGIFCADDLSTTHPDWFRILGRITASETVPVGPDGNPRLMLRTCQDFVRNVFHRIAYKGRGLVVNFNQPFDLSRLATHWGAARGKMYGGFTLRFVDRINPKTGKPADSKYHPNIRLKSQDSKRSSVRFGALRHPDHDDTIPEGSITCEFDPQYRFPGRWLDLRTLGFALTDRAHSLKSLADALKTTHRKVDSEVHGIITAEYVAYARNDTLVTADVLETLRAELDSHPIDLAPDRARSPASIAKAYWRAMGITPPGTRAPQWTPELLGAAAQAYYGGRAECGLRRVSVPVVHTDVTSMYPTAYTLMDLHRFMVAQEIGMEDATTEIQALLETVTPERCFDKAFWRELPALVLLKPDGRDVLPIRADFDGTGQPYNIAIGPVKGADPMWYALPDVVASVVKTGRVPHIERGIRLTATGKLLDLRPVRFGGLVPIDPNSQDPIRSVIEERARVKRRSDLDDETRDRVQRLLKTCANSIGYGVAAEMNRQDAPKDEYTPVDVYTGTHAFRAHVNGVEEPGVMCFMPFAAIVTAAARLMLGLADWCITDAGGSYVFMDTDSACILATRDGGTMAYRAHTPDGETVDVALHARSRNEVQSIVGRFAALNPYNPNALPGSILKIEDVNYPVGADGKADRTAGMQELWCYSIASKRYVLFTRDDDGGFTIVDRSEHGLGHLLDPTKDTAHYDPEHRDWITELWEYLLANEFGVSCPEPDWLNRPAIGRITMTRPEDLKAFATWNARKAHTERVRPFTFALVAYPLAPKLYGLTDSAGQRIGEIDTQHFRLVAPYDPAAANWLSATTRWTDSYTGHEYRLYTCDEPPIDSHRVGGKPTKRDPRPYVRVKSMRDVVNRYALHAEPKRLGSDGEPCHIQTVGMLRPRPVHVDSRLRRYIGKEANRIEEWEAGLLHDPEDVCRSYPDPAHDPFELLVLPILRPVPIDTTARLTGLDRDTVSDIASGRVVPSRTSRDRMIRVAGAVAQIIQERDGHRGARGREGARVGCSLPVARIVRLAESLSLAEALTRCEPIVIGAGSDSVPTRRCPECASPLGSRHGRARYCSAACRKRSQRKRRWQLRNRARRRGGSLGRATGDRSSP